MDLSEKIKLILSTKNISPSIFADEIGIQRASVSHILAGRNKPSLDIVQKIVKRFPELGLNWIMDGEDLPPMKPDVIVKSSVERNPVVVEKRKDEASNSARHVNHSLFKETSAIPSLTGASAPGKEAEIDRVLVFYKDGTFKEFKPGQ